MTRVRVPASSANMGPGFDGLAVALSLGADVGVVDDGTGGGLPERAHVVDESHPATVAFRRGEGRGRLWVRSPIPMGRGLGYSGAMRVGGLAAALVQRHGAEVLDAGRSDTRAEMLGVTAELEGHADNVAASIHGGVVATASGSAARIPTPLAPVVLVWIPATTTSTDRSRSALPSTVPFADAVFNVAHTALLVAALAAGDVAALAVAARDRLHQDRRLAAVAPARAALVSGLEAGAWCGWLSGSGPTIALFCAADDVDRVTAALPPDGDVKRLGVADHGVRLVATTSA
ncbi:MAG: homoserine kinase [Desertimonas sp.]